MIVGEVFKKRIKEISNKISEVNFNKIDHEELLLLSQYYIDSLFQFLNINKEKLGNYGFINESMIYHPRTFNDFIEYYRKYSCKNTDIEELKKRTTKYYVGFYPIIAEKKCYVYIEKYHEFISELAHMALQLVGYSKGHEPDRYVSEIFDGTMKYNFNLNTDNMDVSAEIYACLPKNIKKYIINVSNLKEPITNINHIIIGSELENMIYSNISEINECLNEKGIMSILYDKEKERTLIPETIIYCHMQASYILFTYQKKYGRDDYFQNLWLTIIKCNAFTFENFNNVLENKFHISL